MDKNVKVNLRKIRLDRGLTQRALCDKLGIKTPNGYYQNIENGRLFPSIVKAIQIARVLKCSIEEIWAVKK